MIVLSFVNKLKIQCGNSAVCSGMRRSAATTNSLIVQETGFGLPEIVVLVFRGVQYFEYVNSCICY